VEKIYCCRWGNTSNNGNTLPLALILCWHAKSASWLFRMTPFRWPTPGSRHFFTEVWNVRDVPEIQHYNSDTRLHLPPIRWQQMMLMALKLLSVVQWFFHLAASCIFQFWKCWKRTSALKNTFYVHISSGFWAKNAVFAQKIEGENLLFWPKNGDC